MYLLFLTMAMLRDVQWLQPCKHMRWKKKPNPKPILMPQSYGIHSLKSIFHAAKTELEQYWVDRQDLSASWMHLLMALKVQFYMIKTKTPNTKTLHQISDNLPPILLLNFLKRSLKFTAAFLSLFICFSHKSPFWREGLFKWEQSFEVGSCPCTSYR